jgi:hypothetical protein
MRRILTIAGLVLAATVLVVQSVTALFEPAAPFDQLGIVGGSLGERGGATRIPRRAPELPCRGTGSRERDSARLHDQPLEIHRRQLAAIRLVHPATREANEPLDPVATDRPHHRVDDLTRRRRRHRTLAS